MSQKNGLNRRTFLRSAGFTALAGAVGTATSVAAAAPGVMPEPPDGKFDFDTPYSRIGTDSVKWDRQIEKYGADKIQVGMGIADMDFRAAPCITEALAKRLHHENWGYLATTKSYVETLVKWNKRRYDLDIDPDTIVVSSGVHPGIIAGLKTFSPPGSKVLLTTPGYNGFYGDLRWSHTKAAESPLKLSNGRYSIDFDDLQSRISHETHTMILCNPQNPTGNCWSRDDLMRVGRLCLEHRVILLVDEIHCDFVMKGQKYTPFASLPDKDVVNNSLTFKAASKSFSLAAMKNAFFFSTNPDLLERVKANHRADINTLGVVANQAALTEGDAWLDQLLVYIDGNHDFVEAYTRDKMPLVDYTKAQGTYLAWLDVAKVVDRIDAEGKAAAETEKKDEGEPKVTAEMIVERWFVDHAGVQLNPGSSYGKSAEGHMRMNIGTSRQNIELALDNMASALEKI